MYDKRAAGKPIVGSKVAAMDTDNLSCQLKITSATLNTLTNNRLFIIDKNSGIKFLIDTDSDTSIISCRKSSNKTKTIDLKL